MRTASHMTGKKTGRTSEDMQFKGGKNVEATILTADIVTGMTAMTTAIIPATHIETIPGIRKNHHGINSFDPYPKSKGALQGALYFL